jgi:hypothetical protein
MSISKNQEYSKKFYFQEIDKIIFFPLEGNKGKYRNYNVQTKTTKTISKPGLQTILGELLDSPEVENNYPHTVGYFKESAGEGSDFKPEYLELRKIRIVEEFWLFLNACNL